MDTCYDINELQKPDAQRKKPDTGDHMLYDVVYIKYPEKADIQRQKVEQWLPGSGDQSAKWDQQ